MKTKIYFILAVAVMLGLASCGDKIYPTEYIEVEVGGGGGADANSIGYEVLAGDWVFNPSMSQWEVAIDEEIAADVFAEGAIIGNVYFTENGVDTQAPLPYIQVIEDGSRKYTLVVTCEIEYKTPKSKIYFTVKTTDVVSAEDHIGNYDFKLTYLWPTPTTKNKSTIEGFTKLNVKK